MLLSYFWADDHSSSLEVSCSVAIVVFSLPFHDSRLTNHHLFNKPLNLDNDVV